MSNIGGAVCLVGAQYGSEGKGHVAAHLLRSGDYDACVRVGGPNAGHTFHHQGLKFVSRSLPIGWVDPDTVLYIGPGAVVNPDLLRQEVEEVEQAGFHVKDRLYVDHRAAVVTTAQEHYEGGVDGDGHRRIGSTGEGVGMCRMARINRNAFLFGDQWEYRTMGEIEGMPWRVRDVSEMLAAHQRIMVEGTQGSGLSLTLGPWPYCTSADTNAAQLLSDCGIAPGRFDHTVLVARMNPIRVAGKSGPLDGETSWEALGVEPEVTTVTKKVRRVGMWDPVQLAEAVRVNSPAYLVVMFADYQWPELKGKETFDDVPPVVVDGILRWVVHQERALGCSIIGLGTGPDTIIWRASMWKDSL